MSLSFDDASVRARVRSTRERAARLARRTTEGRGPGRWSTAGLDGTTRQGPIGALLPIELAHDDLEFARRAVCGEQLYHARRPEPLEGTVELALWHFGPESLGAPRLDAIGCLEALADANEGALRVCVNAGAIVSLRSTARARPGDPAPRTGSEALLAVGPAHPPPPLTAWRAAIACGDARSVVQVASADVAAPAPIGEPAWLLRIGSARVELALHDGGRWRTIDAMARPRARGSIR